jgi:flagellin FlaB
MLAKLQKVVAKLHKDIRKDEKGMTGLETAIILIAFVTVAAVFSYAVLSAGLFSAERGKETIYAGLEQAKSNMEIAGSVIATSVDNTSVKTVKFTLKNAIAGKEIDMTPCDGTANATNKCVISLTTTDSYLKNVKWTKAPIGNADGDNLLEMGEQFEITVTMDDLGLEALASSLTVNDTFSLQVKPAIGSNLTIQRTLPPQIDSIMDLH